MNGARNDQTNACLQHILRQLTPADIDRLADDHGIAPRMEEPWRKNITGAGIVVKAKDADNLYEALQQLIRSKDRRRRMGQSARLFAESSATAWTAFADPDGTNPSQEHTPPVRFAGRI